MYTLGGEVKPCRSFEIEERRVESPQKGRVFKEEGGEDKGKLLHSEYILSPGCRLKIGKQTFRGRIPSFESFQKSFFVQFAMKRELIMPKKEALFVRNLASCVNIAAK